MHQDLTSQDSRTQTASKRQAQVGPLKAAVLTAALAAGMLLNQPAHAFDLGNLTTLSALGEPLRLEFEVLDLSPAEVASFRVSLAPPPDFAARGLVFGPVLEGMRLGLVRSPNGRLVIRMEGQRPAAEPFVDLLLNITWASGSATRSVSVMLAPAPGAAAAAEAAPPAASAASGASAAPAAPTAPAAPVSTTPTVAAALPGTVAANPAAANTIVAQRGDTAGELAQRARPPGVEQSQYLLALVQANPGAFVEGNVNRLQAGAKLDLPTQAQAMATPASEARQIVAAQWQEFQAYRQQTATQAASAPGSSDGAGPQAQGQIDSLADAKAPAPADKLTLSKPAVGSAAQAEKALLDERRAQEASARLEELTRTMRELNQLQGSANGSGAAEPGATAVLPPAPPAAKLPPDSALIDRLADHPAVLPVTGGLLALALAWLGLRLRRKVTPDHKEPDRELVLEFDLDPLPFKDEAAAPAAKTEPALKALLDLEAETVPAKRASHS